MNSCLVAVTLTLSLIAPLAAQPPDPTDLDMDGVPGVAPGLENPNPAIPSALVGTGTLLIDHSHHGSPVTAFDVSGFTNYLVSQGWTISILSTGPVTEAALEGADIFLVPLRAAGFGSLLPFTSAEVAAVQSFLSHGKGLWVLHDNEDASGVNTLASNFGITFLYDSIRDPSNNEGQLFWPTMHQLVEHPVTDGVESYGYYSGDCLSVTSPASVVARGDDDAYSFFCPVGTYPPALAVWENEGRAVFAGDITPLHPNYYVPRLRAEEQLLLQNIANWLLGPPPNAVESGTWGGMKARFR